MEHVEVSPLSERSAVAADELAKWWASSSFSGSAALLLQQQLESARAQADYGSFLDALLSQGDALMKSSSTTSSHEESLEDVVSAFGLIIVLLTATPSSSRTSLVLRVVDVVASSASYTESRSSHVARLRILANLFNSLRSSSGSLLNSKTVDEKSQKSLQLEVLKRLVTFASETKQLEVGSPVTSYLVASIGPSWGLTTQQSSDFFLHVSMCYGRMGETDEEQQWLLRHLISFESQSTSENDLMIAIPLARSAAVSYLAAPAGQQKYEVPRLKSVKLLSKFPEHARLYDLVQVVASGGMSSFSEWCLASPKGANIEAAKSELSSLGLNYAHCLETMCLLSFCTLASSSKLLSFESIRSALNCPANEVESWILKATSAGLVDCRIDQLSNQVVVTRCTDRVFDINAWKGLLTQLVSWENILDNLKNLL